MKERERFDSGTSALGLSLPADTASALHTAIRPSQDPALPPRSLILTRRTPQQRRRRAEAAYYDTATVAVGDGPITITPCDAAELARRRTKRTTP